VWARCGRVMNPRSGRQRVSDLVTPDRHFWRAQPTALLHQTVSGPRKVDATQCVAEHRIVPPPLAPPARASSPLFCHTREACALTGLAQAVRSRFVVQRRSESWPPSWTSCIHASRVLREIHHPSLARFRVTPPEPRADRTACAIPVKGHASRV
jgi:hypothetical protein